MFLIVQARSPILHNGHLERYDKQQRNEIVSQFLNRLYFTYVYIVSLFSFVDFTLIVHESMFISINRWVQTSKRHSDWLNSMLKYILNELI